MILPRSHGQGPIGIPIFSSKLTYEPEFPELPADKLVIEDVKLKKNQKYAAWIIRRSAVGS